MIDEHRGRGRHDNLMQPVPPSDDANGWMISYVDVMTLLVVLLVLVIALGRITMTPDPRGREHGEPEAVVDEPRLGIPLPPTLRDVSPPPRDGSPGSVRVATKAVMPSTVSAALGVAGRPSSVPPPPFLLARPTPEETPPHETPPAILLPSGLDLSEPLADTLLILADNPPEGVREVDEEAVAGARFVAEAMRQAPYLADLEGMEVSRIPAGVRLRMQDRLLFESAEAELTAEGRALVAGRLRELVERHPGEVSVEGHSDSRPINTERFPSNWALSSARAIAIVEALVAAGVEPARLRAVGLADSRPLADNDSETGRATNRRVEVTIQAR